MMNPKVKKIWVKNLREHPERQGKNFLGQGTKRCCLGELCDIAVVYGVIPPPTVVNGTYLYGAEGNEGTLPEEVIRWAELADENPDISYHGRVTNLSELNDGFDIYDSELDSSEELEEYEEDFDGQTHISLTWPEIADIIEEQL